MPAQPTSDAQPVAWRYRDYVSGCWFVSAEPYPAGSIAGESVPLYLAPAPAQPRQPLTQQTILECLIRSACLGTVMMSYSSGPYSIETVSRYAQRFAEEIERAITGGKP